MRFHIPLSTPWRSTPAWSAMEQRLGCAAKIASAVEAGLLGMQMQMQGEQFYGGDGIVVKGVENTIRNVGRLARFGMAETDREIIDMMVSSQPQRC